ncbi:MAG: phosphomannomutase/phosphoglucomutase [Nitrososphaerota archaeon]
MRIPAKIFRAYDIRGIYGEDLTEEIAYLVGLGFGNMLGGGEVLMTRDVRLSGPRLASAASDGLMDAGLNVLDGGVCTTPAGYFGIRHYGAVGCVIVTASHNPPEWNGFKLVRGDGETVSQGAGMEELREIITSDKLGRARSRGSIQKVELSEAYSDFLLRSFRRMDGLQLGVDFSDGAACLIFPSIARRLKLEIKTINDNPDGYFRGHPPEPSHENLKQLSKLVIDGGCGLGVAFDGDADRAVFVDDLGRVVEGDQALAIFVNNWPRVGKVVYDVNSSKALKEVAEAKGFTPIEWTVGRAFMLRKVREEGAVLGGEKSNHIYFGELGGVDDGLYAALKMAEIVMLGGGRLSPLVEAIPRYPSLPIKVYECPDEVKFRAVEIIGRRLEEMGFQVSRLDGVKTYIGSGWLLIRASNTMPQLKMTAEAASEEELARLKLLSDMLVMESIRSVS